MTGSALGHKTISERQLQRRVAVGVLEQPAALNMVGVFHSVELVAE